MLGHPATAGLTMFLPLAGCIVLVFTGYQLNMVLRGVTAYESMRWSDLKYAIESGQLKEWDQALQEYNQTVRVHTKPKVSLDQSHQPSTADSPSKSTQKTDQPSQHVRQRKAIPSESIKVPLTSIHQVRNIYQSSLWNHVHTALFPTPLH
jgi:hypothetical protein